MEYRGTSDNDPFLFSLTGNTALASFSCAIDGLAVSWPEGWALSTKIWLADSKSMSLVYGYFDTGWAFFITAFYRIFTLSGCKRLHRVTGRFVLAVSDGGAMSYTWSFAVEPAVVPILAANRLA